MTPLAHLLIILVCLLLSAFFSGGETALLRLRKEEVEQGVKQSPGPSAFAVRDLLKSTSRLLVTILLGNNIVNILASTTAAALAVFYLGDQHGILVATVVMTTVIFVFGEVLPKALAIKNPRQISSLVALPLYFIHQLLRPLHFVFDQIIEPIAQKITGSTRSGETEDSDQLLYLARQIPSQKVDGSPIPIIASAAKAAEMTAAEIMIPRTEIFAFPVQGAPQDLLREAMSERYTRIPIYQGSIDNILGVIHLKDLFKLVQENQNDLNPILKPILRVPERKPILQMLQDMQRGFVHMAIVKDEFGVTEGLLTQEDILEEIVGEIRDEFDQDELETIRKLPDGSYEALGRLKVTDFDRETGWNLKSKPGDTMSGLTYNILGRAPKEYDIVESGGYQIKVIDLSGNRITRVLVSKIKKEPKKK